MSIASKFINKFSEAISWSKVGVQQTGNGKYKGRGVEFIVKPTTGSGDKAAEKIGGHMLVIIDTENRRTGKGPMVLGRYAGFSYQDGAKKAAEGWLKSGKVSGGTEIKK